MEVTTKNGWIFAVRELAEAVLSAEAVEDIANLDTIQTANATDPATTMALTNEIKAKLNAVILALTA